MANSKTVIEFNDEYYAKLLRLVVDHSKEAIDEMTKLRELTLKQYELNGWIDDETLKKLKTPLPPRKKRDDSADETEHPVTSRQSSSTDSPSESPRRDTEKLERKEKSEKKEKKRKEKLESKELNPDLDSAVPVPKKKLVNVFRDDPSIFGALPATGPSVAPKRKSVITEGPAVKKIKKMKPKIIEQRLKTEPRVMSDGEEKKKPGSASASPAARRDGVTADDVASELGLSCAVCHQIGALEKDNALLECLECHRMYHQRCHDPPLSESEFSDPRLVWNCSSCTKVIKRNAAARSIKAEYSSSDESSNPGRSTADKVITHEPATQKPVAGIATLAADFVAKHNKNRVPPGAPRPSGIASNVSTPLPASSLSLKAGIAKLAAKPGVKVKKEAPATQGINSLSAERIQELAAERSASGKVKKAAPVQSSNKDRMLMADKRLQLMKKKAAKNMKHA